MAWLAVGTAVSGDDLPRVWRALILAALRAAPSVTSLANRIGDGDGENAPVPFITVGDGNALPWGGAGRPGREVSWTVTVTDRGPGARIDALVAAVEGVLTALPRSFAGGEAGGVTIVRTAVTRRRDGLRSMTIDARVRLLSAA